MYVLFKALGPVANSLVSPLLAPFSNEYWQASEVHLEILLRSCSCGLALATLWDCNHFEVVSCFSEYSGRKSLSDQCIHSFEILLMLIENKIPKFKNFNILLRTKHYYLKQLRHSITKVFEQCKVQINIMTCIWMASPTRWTWVWVNCGSWWWTGRPGVLRFMGSQTVRHNCVTELNWINYLSYLGKGLASYHSSDFHMSKVSLHV